METRPRQALDHVQVFGVGAPAPVHPEPLVIAHRIDHQRVAFPATHAVSVVAGHQVFGMRPAIHKDGPVGMRPADIEDVYPFDLRDLDDLGAVRGQPLAGSAGGLAPGVRLQWAGAAIGDQFTRPRLVRRLAAIDGRHSAASDPEARLAQGCAEQHTAFFVPRRLDKGRHRPLLPPHSPILGELRSQTLARCPGRHRQGHRHRQQ